MAAECLSQLKPLLVYPGEIVTAVLVPNTGGQRPLQTVARSAHMVAPLREL